MVEQGGVEAVRVCECLDGSFRKENQIWNQKNEHREMQRWEKQTGQRDRMIGQVKGQFKRRQPMSSQHGSEDQVEVKKLNHLQKYSERKQEIEA